jgi:hypothetical protein
MPCGGRDGEPQADPPASEAQPDTINWASSLEGIEMLQPSPMATWSRRLACASPPSPAIKRGDTRFRSPPPLFYLTALFSASPLLPPESLVRQAPGEMPVQRLKARLKAASDS